MRSKLVRLPIEGKARSSHLLLEAELLLPNAYGHARMRQADLDEGHSA
jgi:hypothetical protein